MRYCFLPVILVILSACNFGLAQSGSTPDLASAEPASTGLQSTPTATLPVQFVQVTPTQASANPGAALQPTTTSQEFENGLPLAARVNDQPVFLDSYNKQLAQFEQALTDQGIDITGDDGRDKIKQIKQAILDGLVDQLIIEQQAQELGISITDAEVEAKAQGTIGQIQNQTLFETWLTDNNLTYQEFIAQLRSQLISNRVFEHVTQNVPDTAEQIWLRAIRVDDEVAAQAIIEQLKNGERFVKLADSLDGVTQNKGGDLGWLPMKTGLIPAEVEDIAFTMQPGQIAGPIQTQAGFYIIKLEEKEANRLLAEEMKLTLKNKIFTRWLTQQREAAIIEKFVGL